jgi:inhibitor of KinA sporulation pathway (predicted exonuclease)
MPATMATTNKGLPQSNKSQTKGNATLLRTQRGAAISRSERAARERLPERVQCQIGIAQFKDGALADEWKTHVDPQDHFDTTNVSIHGIDEDVVAGSPTFAKLADTLISRLSGRIIVTHTAFDRVAVLQASTKHNVPPFSCTWLDTACVARRAWSEFSRRGYGLANICASIGYNFQHHDALEDAKAAGRHGLDRGNDADRPGPDCLADKSSPTD